MACIIRLVAPANGQLNGAAGHMLKRYNPDWANGLGRIWSTTREAEALRFDDKAAALALYHTVSTVRPTRLDGRPNKPLTAWTVEIEQVAANG